MTERPILFSAPMILALLSGRKSQTRRIVKGVVEQAGEYTEKRHNCGWFPKARWNIGDRLWVRETWRKCEPYGANPKGYLYRATDALDVDEKWKPSISMPRWASRITLEVTEVRVERLQSITEADAIAEGVEVERPADPAFPQWRHRWPGGDTVYAGARAAYFAGWDMINGKGSAAKNPWVWCVSFRPVTP